MQKTHAEILTELLDPGAVAIAMGGTPKLDLVASSSAITWTFPDKSEWQHPLAFHADFNSFGSVPKGLTTDSRRFYFFCFIKRKAYELANQVGAQSAKLAELAVRAGGAEIGSSPTVYQVRMPDGSMVWIPVASSPRWATSKEKLGL